MLVSVGPDDTVVSALQLMRDKRVRAALVLETDQLKGILAQGGGAINVSLPGLEAKQVLLRDAMTLHPVTVKLADPI